MQCSLFLRAWLAAVLTASVHAAGLQAVPSSASPIKKVLKMLEAIQKRVEADGEEGEELHKKFMCYCQGSSANLQKSIAAAEAKVPETQSAIKEAEAGKAQLGEDLVTHKADRIAAKGVLADSAAVRKKDAAAFAASKAEAEANIAAIGKAVAAIEKGKSGAFLQTRAATVLRSVVRNNEDIAESDRDAVAAFLDVSQGSEQFDSGVVVGILKQLSDEMAKGLAESTAAEEAAVKSYEELSAAKQKEVYALSEAIEKKMVRVGELAVSIVELKDDLSDTEEALLEDKKFLADLTKNCDSRAAEWNATVKARLEELAALAETVKVLSGDDAMMLFKKTLGGGATSLLQIEADSPSLRRRALSAINRARQAKGPGSERLNFIALALRGKKAGFEKVIEMIDTMVSVLSEEQKEDDVKKEYCVAELHSTDDKHKALELKISDVDTAMAAAAENVAGLSDEIKALEDGIKALDRSVAEATEQRKEEHAAYMKVWSDRNAAKELLGVAIKRLNAYYKQALVEGPPSAPVLTQVSAHEQQEETLTQPETPSAYAAKSQETGGVIAMLQKIIGELDKDVAVSEIGEKHSQEDYEEMLADSAGKRASDSKALSEKMATKADMQSAFESHREDKVSATKSLHGLVESIHALHGECDWLLQYHGVRKEARAGEKEALANAKAVLSGADYSFLQTGRLRLRRRSA